MEVRHVVLVGLYALVGGSGAWDGTTSWLVFLPMMLWPIVVIGGIALLLVLLARGGRREPSIWRDGRGQTPFDILRERFARGEIDRQEYEERKGLLSRP